MLDIRHAGVMALVIHLSIMRVKMPQVAFHKFVGQ